MKATPFIEDGLTLQNGNMAVNGFPAIHTAKGSAAKYQYPAQPFAETIHNGFFTVDRKWTVTYWNKAAEELLRVKAKHIIGKNLWEEFAGIIPLNFYTVYQNAFLQDTPVHFEEYWAELGS